LDEEEHNTLLFKRLGDFRIVEEIGRGASGTVFSAVQESLNRSVAVKVLSSSFGLQEKTVQRFHREAEALARIQHENIVPVYHVGTDRGVYYYAMELVDGTDIHAMLREGPLSPVRAATLIRDAARAVEAAHQKGIIHRDLKPANLIVTKDDRVRITDFGLAKIETGGTITESGTLVGTPMYMSPEQALGSRRSVGRTSDVYSLGATLYEMVTAEPLFASENFQAILRMIVETDPVPPRRHRQEIPRDLETIILKALHKDPIKRYPTASAMADDLDRFLQREPVRARRTSLLERGVHRLRKHRRLALILGPLLSVLIGVIVHLYRAEDSGAYLLALQAGKVEALSQNHELAIQYLEDACSRDRSQWEPHIWLGRVRAQLGETEAARRDFDRAVEIGQEEVEPRVARARFLLDQEQVEEADRDLLEALRLDSAHPTALAFRARILYHFHAKQGTDGVAEDLAAECSRKVLSLPDAPDEARIEALRIAALRDLEQPDLNAALQRLREASALDPNDDETNRLLRRVLDWQRTAGIERATIRTWLRWFNPLSEGISPLDRFGTGLERGIDSLQSGLERAQSLLERFTGDRPGDLTLEELNRKLRENPTDCRSLIARGKLFETDAKYFLAAADYQTAAEECIDDPEPFFRLAVLYSLDVDSKFRDLEAAGTYARKAIVRAPEVADYLDLFLVISREANQIDQVRAFFRDFFAVHRDHPHRSRIEKELFLR